MKMDTHKQKVVTTPQQTHTQESLKLNQKIKKRSDSCKIALLKHLNKNDSLILENRNKKKKKSSSYTLVLLRHLEEKRNKKI